MKILIAADSYYPHVDGASIFAQRLAVNLRKKGNDVVVISPSRRFRTESYEHEGVKIFGVNSVSPIIYYGFRIGTPIFSKKKIGKLIQEFQPDIVHLQAHFFVGKTVFRIAKKLGFPIVGTNHFLPENLVHYLPAPERLRGRIKKFGWKQFLEVYNHLDIITTPTQTAAAVLRKIGFKKDVLPISCGIDLGIYNPRNDGEYLRKVYNLPQKPILLYLGRLDREKNIDLVLRVLKNVLKKIDIHFVIAGKGHQAQKWKKLTKELGLEKNVTFTGYVPEVDKPNLYALADCFIIGGEAELQCISAMEAMASGLPIIAIDAVALPELVHHGENGFLFKKEHPEKLEKYLIAIFSDNALRKRMSQKSLEMIQRHDIRKTIEKFISVYQEAIRNHAKNN